MKRAIVFSLTILFLGLATSFAQTDAQFAKANREFASGDFKAAVEDYEALVRSGQHAANLFYNLGNAYFRKSDFGRAILNYERALALDPHHPEAEANLQIARDEAHALELMPDRWESVFAFAAENQFVITAAVAFWIGMFSIAALVLNRQRRLVALSILSWSIFAGAVVGAYVTNRTHEANAIVIAENVEARLATADNANRVLTLPPGSEIKIVSQRGDWIYAALPNNLRGWIPANSSESVRM